MGRPHGQERRVQGPNLAHRAACGATRGTAFLWRLGVEALPSRKRTLCRITKAWKAMERRSLTIWNLVALNALSNCLQLRTGAAVR